MSATISGHKVCLGSAKFILGYQHEVANSTKVNIMIDDLYLGYFAFAHHYREGMEKDKCDWSLPFICILLSGDQDHERFELVKFFKEPARMHFNQSPQDKLDFIRSLQNDGRKIMMIGDGLNDSGALKQSDVGVAITDNVNNFSPGSDAILDGRSFDKLPTFLSFSKDAVRIIHISFFISLAYNLIGLSFAVTGNLSPLMAAILMPLSTVTIISFTSVATHLAAKKRKLI